MKPLSWLTLLVLAVAQTSLAAPPGTQGEYLVLTAKHNQPPPFGMVRITSGPVEHAGRVQGQWLQMDIATVPGTNTPLLQLRLLASGNLLEKGTNGLQVVRYLLRIPETGELLEYRNIHTSQALLPAWTDFPYYFLPQPAMGSQSQHGLPETCALLGHVLTLFRTRTNAAWPDWPAARQLDLDPELLVGTSRPFRDKEMARLPQVPKRQNYTYIPFTQQDYRLMIDAGFNLFTINPDQEKWVRSEPVFYHRGVKGEPPLQYPADLYRANYLGPEMFMDEPSILTVGDTNIHRTLKYFSDAAALIEMRTRQAYESAGGAWTLEKILLGRGVNLGDMRIKQVECPSWETLYDTAFYQMKGGGIGFVHEGRYQLAEFDQAVARFTGQPRSHTAEELLRYHYAFLRGGTRPFHKWWGTAIYGQCDTNIAPGALTLAYDLGARYLWFWTSDHDHHVPWPEQLALVRYLRKHVQAHPRPSIFASQKPAEVGVLIPYGYFLSLENLWWVRVLDKEGKNEASQKYRRLMQRAWRAVHECLDKHQDFEVTVDDGRTNWDYQKVIKLSDALGN